MSVATCAHCRHIIDGETSHVRLDRGAAVMGGDRTHVDRDFCDLDHARRWMVAEYLKRCGQELTNCQ